ncbi:MAG TPA: response regulator transcription factor [Bacteroidia bacterium]|jgi:two-component system alkaline phosphatase synthesis response regulator PhoP|nr:response regulator transcription factor [Bacteroidia bacterium]
MQSTILIVEDEESLGKTLLLNLELENYNVKLTKSGNEALQLFTDHHKNLNLVLLDVMLPEINGFELCQKFKSIDSKVPVIFLTAKNQTSEKISGLKLGADDYITKPFELEELLLRIQNVIKRNFKTENSVYTFGKCSINFETFEIKDIAGEISTLSKREIGLLKLLTDNENKVISRDEIIENLWSEKENSSSRTIDNYILGFRKYFEVNAKEPKHFHSIRGVGYKFTF